MKLMPGEGRRERRVGAELLCIKSQEEEDVMG